MLVVSGFLFLLSVVRCHHLLHSLCPSSLISHKRLRKIGGSCWSASRNCQNISHSGLPRRNKTNYSPSQPPHCPLGSGLKLSELSHMAPHVWLCHSIRKPLKRHFLSLICIFLLSLICSLEHKDFLCLDLFSYMLSFLFPSCSIVHLFTIFRSRKHTNNFYLF